MQVIGRWNYETREYDLTERPDEWNLVLYSEDMDLVVNCINCGKDLVYGNGFTSQEWHNPFGLGFPVCEDCYSEESKRRSEARENGE